MKTALLALATLISLPAFAAGSYYDWSPIHPGRCFEFTPRGDRIGQVPDSYCR